MRTRPEAVPGRVGGAGERPGQAAGGVSGARLGSLLRGLVLPSLPGALCKGITADLWFESVPGPSWGKAAKAVCGGCPVRVRCLEWALEAGEAEGVWGGTTPAERAVIRQQRRAGGGR